MQGFHGARGGKSAFGFFLIPFVSAAFATRCDAGWTVVNLHPGGATSSTATGIRSGVVSGAVDSNAVMWKVTPGPITMTTLGPGAAHGTDGQEVAGLSTGNQAAVWDVLTATYTDLTPSPTPVTNPAATYAVSAAAGVFDGRQAGQILFNNLVTHAGFWTDSGASFVDLNDNINPGSISEADGVGFDQTFTSLEEVGYQFGVASPQLHATIWHDDAASAQDVNPSIAFSSRLYGVSFGKQVGYVFLNAGGGKHAGLWSGTAGSFIDLNPSAPGVVESVASAVYNNGTTLTEAGTTYFGLPEVGHASYWNSTAASWEDLQSYLPANYTSSSALGIWTTNAGVSYITGFAHNSDTDQDEAELWVQTPNLPEPGVMTVLCVAGMMTMRRRLIARNA